MTNLIVPAGVPGSGKTTWARSFFDLKYAVVSTDDGTPGSNGLIIGKFHDKVRECLVHNVDTIADATNLTKKARAELIQIAWDSNSKAHLVLFKNVMQATIRNPLRDEDAVVPESVMQRMMTCYYNTLAEIGQEAWDTITKIESF